MSEDLRLQSLFAKYLQRNCSPQELEEMLFLLEKAEAENILDDHFREVWEKAKNDKLSQPVDWDSMYQSIISADEQIILSRPRKRKWLYPAAAAVVAIIVTSYFWIFSNRAVKPGQQTTIANTAIPVKKLPGGRQTIHLPDGSSVVLNTGSTLNYPSGFSRGRRDVYLSGEGFFDIRHDPQNPFYVHIGEVAVKVLGTAFNIRSEPGAERVEITVTRGKVQVLNKDRNIAVLTASQQLSLLKNEAPVITEMIDTIPVIAWKPAEIYFNDISMEDAVRRLESLYNVSVSFDDPRAKSCRVTATFSEDDLAEEILTVICAVSKTEFTINNNKITIHGKGCD